jgi:hypothetical protein
VTFVEDEPHLRFRVVMRGEPLPPLPESPYIERPQGLRPRFIL